MTLRCLLEEVETCCRDEGLVRWSKAWEEGERNFKLEHRLNGAGKYLFCSVVTEEVKRFSFEGRGFHGGWAVLAEKLRSLGVIPSVEIRGVVSPVKARRTQNKGTVNWWNLCRGG